MFGLTMKSHFSFNMTINVKITGSDFSVNSRPFIGQNF